MSDSLRPHELQHDRPPCPSPTPGVYSNSCPSSRWCHPAVSSSVVPFSSRPQSLPASGSLPVSQLFAWGGQSIGVSASASVLPMNTQDWSLLGWAGWISLQSKGLSRVCGRSSIKFARYLKSHSMQDIHPPHFEEVLEDACSPLRRVVHQRDQMRLWLLSLSNSLCPRWLQHTRLPCPSPSPGAYSNSCPLSRRSHPTISSSVIPFSSCPQSFPASGSFLMSQFIISGGQSIGVSASMLVLPMNIQNLFPLGWTGWISLQSKGLSRVFSNSIVQKHQFFGTQLSYT